MSFCLRRWSRLLCLTVTCGLLLGPRGAALAEFDLSAVQAAFAGDADDNLEFLSDAGGAEPRPIDFLHYQEQASWSVAADALFLHRSAPLSEGNLIDYQGGEVSNTSALGLGTHGGPRLILLRPLRSGWLLDLEYFGIDGWSGTESAGPGSFLLVSQKGFAGPPVQTANFLYASRIRTAEINLRVPGNRWVQPLIGIRWVGMHETYQANGQMYGGGKAPYLMRYNTRNNLYGAQVGGNFLLWDRGGNLTISSLNKAGLYLGDSLNSASLVLPINSGPTPYYSAAQQLRPSFFGEVGVIATWQISKHVSLRGGYQLYWLNGAALATSQPASTDMLFQRDGINSGGQAFLHGPSAGLQFVW